MPLDPRALAVTALQTFGDDFNSLSLFNGIAGTWETTFPWTDRIGNGGSLNDEQEWYINSRFSQTAAIKPWSVMNGILTLMADRAPGWVQPLINNYQYTSGLLTTYKSFAQLFGYFECSARLPRGQGLWPAFWMDQATVSDWPATGATWPPEIDIFEVLGKDPQTLYVTVHTGTANLSDGKAVKAPDLSLAFHTYGVGWWKDYTIFYFDGNEVHRLPTPSDMQSRPMFMMLNLALGGSWGGAVDASTVFPAKMLVDYVRVYRSKDGSIMAPAPGGVIVLPPPVIVSSPAIVLNGTVADAAGAVWDVKVTKR